MVCAFYGQDNEPILVFKLVSQLGQCTGRNFDDKTIYIKNKYGTYLKHG